MVEKLDSPDTWWLSKPLSDLCPLVVANEVWPPVHNLKNISRNEALTHDFINSHKQKCVDRICFQSVRLKGGGTCVAVGDGGDKSQQMSPHDSSGIIFIPATRRLPLQGSKDRTRATLKGTK